MLYREGVKPKRVRGSDKSEVRLLSWRGVKDIFLLANVCVFVF